MEKEKRVIAKIRVDKKNQKRLTIPKEDKTFKDGDYVEIKLLKD
jgi:hypothetical protein